MNLINLTKQPITFLDGHDMPLMTIKPSGDVATISTNSSIERYISANNFLKIPVATTTYGEPSELPAEQPDTLYIVSSLYRTRNPRHDLVSPGPLKRDADGNPIGTQSLIQ
mgnify:CR=1 FL=1